MKSVELSDIESVLPLKTWWAMLFVLPLSRRLTRYVVNNTSLSPNLITGVGLLLRLITGVCFFYGSIFLFWVGAFSFFAAYVCDCTDGAVARLTGKASEFGRYLDHISDLVGDVLILISLSYSVGLIDQVWIWAMVYMHVAECYISYLSGFAFKAHRGGGGELFLFRLFNDYRQFFFSRNIKSFFSFPDYTAIVFIVFPVLGFPELGLRVGFCLLLMIVFYTVLSTFVSLHTDERRFP